PPPRSPAGPSRCGAAPRCRPGGCPRAAAPAGRGATPAAAARRRPAGTAPPAPRPARTPAAAARAPRPARPAAGSAPAPPPSARPPPWSEADLAADVADVVLLGVVAVDVVQGQRRPAAHGEPPDLGVDLPLGPGGGAGPPGRRVEQPQLDVPGALQP